MSETPTQNDLGKSECITAWLKVSVECIVRCRDSNKVSGTWPHCLYLLAIPSFVIASFLGRLSPKGEQIAVSISKPLCSQELVGKEHSSDFVLRATDCTHLNHTHLCGWGSGILSGARHSEWS